MRPRRQERAGTAAADHFQLIAKTAATAARGTTAAHEPIAGDRSVPQPPDRAKLGRAKRFGEDRAIREI